MNKGFVLLETIIVISVLNIILVSLYISYFKILTNVNNQSLYDNTEYIYKTSIVRDYLEKNFYSSSLDSQMYLVYCNNFDENNKCQNRTDDYETKLFSILGVEAVYIFKKINDIDIMSLNDIEPTTLSYIKSLDLKSDTDSRIVVMFREDINNTYKEVFQYANLSFESLV